jgi:hypothetical protein
MWNKTELDERDGKLGEASGFWITFLFSLLSWLSVYFEDIVATVYLFGQNLNLLNQVVGGCVVRLADLPSDAQLILVNFSLARRRKR